MNSGFTIPSSISSPKFATDSMFLLLNTEQRQSITINEIDVYAATAGTVTIQVFQICENSLTLLFFSQFKILELDCVIRFVRTNNTMRCLLYIEPLQFTIDSFE